MISLRGGYDKNGIKGSPIRILDKIKGQIGQAFQKNVKINVYLNEFQPNQKPQTKFEQLKDACSNYLEQNDDVRRAINLDIHNEDSEVLFAKLLPVIRKYPSLVYLDQNGVKFLSDEYLLSLENSFQTDFLYFVSSSYFVRFGQLDEFKKYLDIDASEVRKKPYKFIHRLLLEKLRSKLHVNSNLRLYPYSIKKGANIYGIIFGASHLRAVDKFLSIAWKKAPLNGEADFDIDDDEIKMIQTSLFDDQPLTKLQKFYQNVEQKILSKEVTNNLQLYEYALGEGHLGSHAADCLRKMKNNGTVFYDAKTPLVTYENFAKRRKLEYRIKSQ